MTMLLPNFLCLGAPKCGTTWLSDCLRQHPEIFIPQEKEVHFFNVVGGVDVYETRGVKWYAGFYRDAGDAPLRGDLSPHYFHNDYVPARIKNVLPDCKMIILLRNPIDRAYSDYWMWLRRGDISYCFEDLLKGGDPQGILRTGLYAQHLESYLAQFPREQFLVGLTEDIWKDPQKFLSGVYSFIGVDPSFKPHGISQRSNEAFEMRSTALYHLGYRTARALNLNGLNWLRRLVKRSGLPDGLRRLNYYKKQYPPLPSQDREVLKEYYRDDVKRLSVLLHRNLDHWLA